VHDGENPVFTLSSLLMHCVTRNKYEYLFL
jgi:hypothetical protein